MTEPNYESVKTQEEHIEDEEIEQLLQQEEQEVISIPPPTAAASASTAAATRPQPTPFSNGIYGNMSAKPDISGRVFEEIEPPSYHEAIVDPAPDYFINCKYIR